MSSWSLPEEIVRRVVGFVLVATGLALIPVMRSVLDRSRPTITVNVLPADVRVTGDHVADSYRLHDGGEDATSRACSTGRREQNEPTVAVDPRDPEIVVAGANDYCAAMVNESGWMGYYRSTDGGRTWAASLVPGYPADSSEAGRASPAHPDCDAGSDPTQAFDGQGHLFYGFICVHLSGDSLLGASMFVATYDEDGGRYVRTTRLARATSEASHDKPNLAVDQSGGLHSGNVYVAWVEFSELDADESGRGTILFSRSIDHGATFSEPVPISRLRVAHFPDVAVGPDGSVYVAFRVESTIWITKSSDGGVTFEPQRLVTSLAPFDSWTFGDRLATECGDGPYECETGFTFSRFQTQAAVAADENGVHVAWNERRQGQSKVLVRTSADGVRWSVGSVLVDDVPAGHQYFPDLASADGLLTVVFHDSRGDPAYDPARPPGNTADGRSSGGAVDTFVAQSSDGGLTWRSRRITTVSSNFGLEAPGPQIPFWGDYIYVSAVPGAVHVAWTDSRDLVLGSDPLEPGSTGDRDGFDVYETCTYVPDDIDAESYSEPKVSDPCLSEGGHDQNIYAARV